MAPLSLAIIPLPNEVGKILCVLNIQVWDLILSSFSNVAGSLPIMEVVLVVWGSSVVGRAPVCSPAVH